MQTFLSPANLEGLLTKTSDVLAQRDAEPASPFADLQAIAAFWTGETTRTALIKTPLRML